MRYSYISIFLAAVLAFGVAGQACVCAAQTPGSSPAPAPLKITPKPGTTIEVDPPDYSSGLRAMDERRWPDALKSFDKLAKERPDYAEGALYWKAYNLEKLDRKSEASATCDELASNYPNSSWNNECVALRVSEGIDVNVNPQINVRHIHVNVDTARINAEVAREMAGANRESTRELSRELTEMDRDEHADDGKPHDPNDDLKLLALNSLMQQEPEKALPMLRGFIVSDKPIELRKRALFVLGESKAPGAQELLVEIARKNADVPLQRAAVQTLATTRGKRAVPELVSIYGSATDVGVKHAAVSGLFIAGDAPGLVTLARGEKDIEMKRDIVSQLALMHDPAATAYMEELLK